MSELPDSWSLCRLGDYAYLKNGFAFSSKSYVVPGADTVPVIRISDINGKVASDSEACHVAKGDAVQGFKIAQGDLLIAMSGATTGKIGIYRGVTPAYQNQRVGNIRLLNEKFGCTRYRNHLIAALSNEILKAAYGGAQPNISGSAIEGMEIPLAPLNEQKRIADKLDAVLARVDACRERLDRVPAILKRFRQSVLAAATSGKLTEEWREDSQVVEYRVGDEEVSFPSTWSICKIGDVLSLIDGDRGPNYPKANDYQVNGHCLFLSTKNVREFGFLFDDVIFISEQKHRVLRQGTLERGDVVITTRGTLGNVAVYDETVLYPVVRINSGMLILRKKNTEVLGNFLKIYIASPFFTQQLDQKRSGSAQPQLPAGILKSFLMPIPPTAEQHEIIRRVESLFAYADRLEARYAAARAQVERLTPALLAKAFRGELVPQDPNDEPASVLLERIRALGVGRNKRSVSGIRDLRRARGSLNEGESHQQKK